MFRKILLPVDGSALSEVAIASCIGFAVEAGAKIVCFHAVPPFSVFDMGVFVDGRVVGNVVREDFERNAAASAAAYLEGIAGRARAAGVECSCVQLVAERAHEAIIALARAEGCDLVFMASHGRSGIEGLLLGSVTQKVLAHSKIPVLVYRGSPPLAPIVLEPSA